jgi:3-methyl-2-oxobutanoate hydroxymethyltransferase
MSKDQARSEATATSEPTPLAKREKRTITEIRESKKTKEKIVYMSVPDYTSVKWADEWRKSEKSIVCAQ